MDVKGQGFISQFGDEQFAQKIEQELLAHQLSLSHFLSSKLDDKSTYRFIVRLADKIECVSDQSARGSMEVINFRKALFLVLEMHFPLLALKVAQVSVSSYLNSPSKTDSPASDKLQISRIGFSPPPISSYKSTIKAYNSNPKNEEMTEISPALKPPSEPSKTFFSKENKLSPIFSDI